MQLVKIDFKEFIRQHYWLGWYWWNSCVDHKHYNSRCETCDEGSWSFIDNHSTGALPPTNKKFVIFRMPMNNVVWTLGKWK